MLFEFPTQENWLKLVSTYPFKNWDIPPFALQLDEKSVGVNDQMQVHLSMPIWEMHLQNRLADVQRSYVFLMYYFELGIPDAEWMISPGKNGTGISYFPHFDHRHYKIKDQFDYFTDIFYYKAFSVWDTVGQMLNEMYLLRLKVDKVDFKTSIEKLKDAGNGLHSDLLTIWNDEGFKKARGLRHSISHRHPENKQGPTFARRKTNDTDGFTAGGCSYTPSKEIVDNVVKVLELISTTLEVLSVRCSSIRPEGGLVITV